MDLDDEEAPPLLVSATDGGGDYREEAAKARVPITIVTGESEYLMII